MIATRCGSSAFFWCSSPLLLQRPCEVRALSSLLEISPATWAARITVIVRTTGGYYWDDKHGSVIAGAKMFVGAAIGKTLDDSIEGRVQP